MELDVYIKNALLENCISFLENIWKTGKIVNVDVDLSMPLQLRVLETREPLNQKPEKYMCGTILCFFVPSFSMKVITMCYIRELSALEPQIRVTSAYIRNGNGYRIYDAPTDSKRLNSYLVSRPNIIEVECIWVQFMLILHNMQRNTRVKFKDISTDMFELTQVVTEYEYKGIRFRSTKQLELVHHLDRLSYFVVDDNEEIVWLTSEFCKDECFHQEPRVSDLWVKMNELEETLDPAPMVYYWWVILCSWSRLDCSLILRKFWYDMFHPDDVAYIRLLTSIKLNSSEELRDKMGDVKVKPGILDFQISNLAQMHYFIDEERYGRK